MSNVTQIFALLGCYPQRRSAVNYRRGGTTYRSFSRVKQSVQEEIFWHYLTLDGGTDRLTRNGGT
jgi:hypothetical protein